MNCIGYFLLTEKIHLIRLICLFGLHWLHCVWIWFTVKHLLMKFIPSRIILTLLNVLYEFDSLKEPAHKSHSIKNHLENIDVLVDGIHWKELVRVILSRISWTTLIVLYWFCSLPHKNHSFKNRLDYIDCALLSWFTGS